MHGTRNDAADRNRTRGGVSLKAFLIAALLHRPRAIPRRRRRAHLGRRLPAATLHKPVGSVAPRQPRRHARAAARRLLLPARDRFQGARTRPHGQPARIRPKRQEGAALNAAICRAIVHLLAESTGRGPTKARTTIDRDLIVVVLQ